MINAETQSRIYDALAGQAPYALPTDNGHEWEDWKSIASAGRRAGATAKDRAPFIMLHALSHWYRAWYSLGGNRRGSDLKKKFPDGLPFKRYLASWLTAVGKRKLEVSEADAAEVCRQAGIQIEPEATCILEPGYTYVFKK